METNEQSTEQAAIPIAYRQGVAGPIIHRECWNPFAADYMARTGMRPAIETLYQKTPHKGCRCGHCLKLIA